jgi:lipopolysaccharide transport system permease protein
MIDELIIESGSTQKNYWRDLWRYRELFFTELAGSKSPV